MDVYNIIIVFVAVSFIAYGINSFISNKMILEFKRWGLEKRRRERKERKKEGGERRNRRTNSGLFRCLRGYYLLKTERVSRVFRGYKKRSQFWHG